MRICIIVRILWPGGVQRIAFAEAEGLKNLGNEVDLIFIRSTKKYIYDSNVNYNVIYGDKISNRLLGRIFKKITLHYLPQRGEDSSVDIDLIYKTEHSIKKKYDIIYYFDEFSAFFQKHNKKKFGNKSVVLIHEVAAQDKSKLLRFVQWFSMKNADIVLTNSEENLIYLKELRINNSFKIYPGLVPHADLPSFENKEDIALSVTMWDYGRKPEVLLEIARFMKYGKMLIVGSWTDNKYMEKIRESIEKSKLMDKITVTGPINENDLINLYKRAKVSIRFGFDEKGPGMGSLESISWGLPIIINQGIGIKEVIKDGINGYIVNEKYPQQIANLICDLFKDQNKWSFISNQNLILQNELSWDKHCQKLNSVFKQLLLLNE